MERSEFRDIMFQYKKAKELDPQLKYWDWKADKYEKGSDGIKATPEQEKQINEHMQKMHRMSGAISPVINLQDAADFTPVGNATTAYEAYDAAESGDYLTASLIGAAALAPRAVSKGVKKIWREIPSVNPNYVKDKLTEFFGNEKVRKLLPNGLKAEIYEDAINQRNHIIEELYHDKDYWDRAAAIKKQFEDDYPEIYRGLLDTYENRYLGLPEPKVKSFNNGAKAEMSASEQAKERFRLNRIPAGYTDFEYNISPHLDKIDNPTTLHELNHYIDFNLAKNGNADYGNNMFVEMKKDLSTADNILYPDKTDYFRQGTEQKSYMNTLRNYMNSIGLMDSPGQKVSTKTIKKAIQSLPSEMNAVRAAYLQFNSPGQYTKWFNKIPLLGTAGAGLYIGNKEDNSYSEGTNGIKYYGAYSPKDQSYLLPVYNENGQNNVVLPEVTVTPQNNTDLKEVMDTRDFASELASYSPVGDVQDIYDIGKNVYDGNYGQAALGAGLFFLPDALAKSIRKLYGARKISKILDTANLNTNLYKDKDPVTRPISKRETADLINFDTAKKIMDANMQMQDFYTGDDYARRLQKAYEYTGNKAFANIYIPTQLKQTLQKGIEILPDNIDSSLGVTQFNKNTRRPQISINTNAKEHESLNELKNTINHEVAHASLKGGGASNIWVQHIRPYLYDIINLRNPIEIYNNFDLRDADKLQRFMSFNEYPTDIDEIRSRTYSLYQNAKRRGVNFDEFIDKYTFDNPKIWYGKIDAPGELNDLLKIMTPQSIKDFGKKFLGLSIPTLMYLNTNDKSN